jgi:hypothetical protein
MQVIPSWGNLKLKKLQKVGQFQSGQAKLRTGHFITLMERI